VLVVLAGVAVYAGALHGPFLFDDVTSLVQNPTIQRLWAWPGPLAPPHLGITVEGRPILNLSFALNYAFGAEEVSGYHATNLLIHLLAGLTLFGIIRRTPGIRAGSIVAFAAALLWTIHPLQTEAVTYTVQRAESLMGLFYLLTLYGFVRRWYALSVLACLLGMGTKEVMVSAPVLVFFYDRAFVAGSIREAWRQRRGYYAALGATWLLLAWEVCASGNRGGTSGLGSGVGLGGYLLTQTGAVAHYLRLSVWPHPLVFDYGVIPAGRPADWIAPLLLVAALAAGTLWAAVRHPAAGFLGLWFFALLAPTSLVPGNRQTWAEHRMYLPLAAVLVALVLVADRILARPAFPPRRRPHMAAALLLAASLAAGAMTVQRNRVYRTAEALYAATVRERPDNPYAHADYGLALGQAGRTDAAIAELGAALRLKPDFADAHYNLGLVLMRAGRTSEGIEEYESAVRAWPDFPQALYNLGIARAAQGRNAEAIADFSRAVRAEPDFAAAHVGLGKALVAEGRLVEGAAELDRSLELGGDSAAARRALGSMLAEAGLRDRALREYEIAARLDPASAEIQTELRRLRSGPK